MHRQIRGLGALTLLLALATVPALAQTVKDDPAIGSWILNRAQSTFSGAPPEKRTIKIEVVGDAIKESIQTWVAAGNSDIIEFTAKFDGKDVPISNSVLSTVSLKRLDKNIIERTGKTLKEVTETRKRTVSADGKTMTIETKGTNGGQEYTSTQVFDKTQ